MASSLLMASQAQAILEGAGLLRLHTGQGLPQAARVCVRAQEVRAGDIFLAYKGVSFDAHSLIPEAVQAGASLIVLDDPEALPACGAIPALLVTSSREAWPFLAAAMHGNPERELSLAGITGTNGKTSTTWIFRELLTAMGGKAMSLGTIGAWFGQRHVPTEHTTPDPDALFSLLRQAVNEGIRYGAMEVSSHALHQAKLGPILFTGAGMTSFTRDHLDYHRSMDEYFAAKWLLFERHLRSPSVPVGFATDVEAKWLQPRVLPAGTFFYGESASHDAAFSTWPKLAFRLLTADRHGSVIALDDEKGTRQGRVPFLGGYALANFVLALGLVERMTGESVPAALWEKVRAVPGRLEPVMSEDGQRLAFVDYAHTPDALEKTLGLVRRHCRGRLLLVFGCGGDRDAGKRPLMGEVAARLADLVVVTSDNPRTEDPERIIADIIKGIPDPARVVSEPDRATAIRKAVGILREQDILVVAGKGHEDYQIIGKEKRPFDDRQIVARYLRDHELGMSLDES